MFSFRLCLLFILMFIFYGCATLPKEFQGLSFDRNATISQVLASPEKYKDVNVLWGGKIVSCVNKEMITLLEVVYFPLDSEGRPKVDTKSEGRFQVETPDFLDCAIYSPGRLITVSGIFKGLKEGKIGERPYKFPLIEGKVFHLWKEELKVELEPYPCYWCPWWHPYWYPWWYCPWWCF